MAVAVLLIDDGTFVTQPYRQSYDTIASGSYIYKISPRFDEAKVISDIPSKFYFTIPLDIMPLKLGAINTGSIKRAFTTIRRGIATECKYWWRRKKQKKYQP